MMEYSRPLSELESCQLVVIWWQIRCRRAAIKDAAHASAHTGARIGESIIPTPASFWPLRA